MATGDAAGDIIKTADMVIDEGLCKTDVALVIGDVVAFDTDGWAQAGATSKGPFGVNLTTVAVSSGQVAIRVLRRGVVVINKDNSSDIYIGNRVKNIAAGEVDIYVSPDWPSTFDEAGCQAEIDLLEMIVGVAVEDVVAATLLIRIRLGAW